MTFSGGGAPHSVRSSVVWASLTRVVSYPLTNLYWKYQKAPGRTAGTVETKEVDFGATS